MSKRDEKISAYLDGEMHSDEVMSFSLSSEQTDAATSTRYRLIGDALRNEMTEASFVDVSAAVSQALAHENIADQCQQQGLPATSSTPAETRQVGGWQAWLRPFAGMAVAASVAAVMVIAVTQPDTPVSTPVAANSTANRTVNEAIARMPVARPPVVALTPQVNQQNGQLVQAVPVSNEGGLNPYLNEHIATQGMIQGMVVDRMPGVRSVRVNPVRIKPARVTPAGVYPVPNYSNH